MPDRPNIVFFFSDQQRWDTIGCYGQPLDVTPNLDRLAGEGVRFDRAFTCQPLCGPARACLQTGVYATETGCFRNDIALPTDRATIARLLGSAGYEAGYLGKWHLASQGGSDGPDDFRTKPIPPQRRAGYDDFWLASDVLEFTSHGYDGHMFDADGNERHFPPGRYRVDAQTDWAIEYLRTRTGERPFFLFVSYIEPHHQNDHKRFEGPRGSREKFKDFVPPGDLADAGGDWRESYGDYLGCINSLDANLGRIRDELDALGLAGSTLIIYTSDHGCHFRTRNKEYKRSCHEASIRVPMIISGPGFAGGQVVDELVSLIDLPPTIVTAAGAAVPEHFRGRPLQQALGGAPPDWPKEVFVQVSEDHLARAIRTDRWKYSVWAPGASGGRQAASDEYVEQCLYDLQADPHELSNLVAEGALAELRAELAERLKKRIVAAGEAEPAIRPAGP